MNTTAIRRSCALLTTEVSCLATAAGTESQPLAVTALVAAVGCVVAAGVHTFGVLNR